jgi:hypothetical protein
MTEQAFKWMEGTRWRHRKRGSTYTVLHVVTLQAAGPLDGVSAVVYVCEHDGTVWCRPVLEFRDGRFEQLG